MNRGADYRLFFKIHLTMVGISASLTMGTTVIMGKPWLIMTYFTKCTEASLLKEL
jgi:hypothetical protein